MNVDLNSRPKSDITKNTISTSYDGSIQTSACALTASVSADNLDASSKKHSVFRKSLARVAMAAWGVVQVRKACYVLLKSSAIK